MRPPKSHDLIRYVVNVSRQSSRDQNARRYGARDLFVPSNRRPRRRCAKLDHESRDRTVEYLDWAAADPSNRVQTINAALLHTSDYQTGVAARGWWLAVELNTPKRPARAELTA